MPNRIERDEARFRRIVKGQIRKELRKYISRGELIGKEGDELVSIPVPQIDLPRFRFGREGQEGVGQGEGDVGAVFGPGQGQGSGQAGDSPGEHIMEVELTIAELAELLGEALELPHIEPRGKQSTETDLTRYTGISQTGPDSLRHFRRTYKAALRRQISSGSYDPNNPIVIPIREDTYYRSWKVQHKPEASAVIVYMMDVSGSMGDEQKEIVRTEAFWIDTWLQSHYPKLETRYVIHDAAAREVDKHTFFHTRESGGTVISSAYELGSTIIERDYPAADWNIYQFHFSDGDNWDSDNLRACQILATNMPKLNMFGYGQVASVLGSGRFKDVLREYFASRPELRFADDKERLVISVIKNREAIMDSIKDFLGKGN